MPKRPATVTQADIARMIRAAKDAGLPVQRIVWRPDGVAIETGNNVVPLIRQDEKADEPIRDIVL